MEENKKEVKSFKIINKTKDGLTIILYGKKVNLTWEEFKADYVMEKDRVSCHFNKKAQEKLDKAEELLTQGTMAAMAVNSPKAEVDPSWKLNNLSVLGSVSQQLSELMGLSLAEVTQLIQGRIDILRGVDTKKAKRDWKKFNKEAKAAKKEAMKEQEERGYGRATMTLGDLPAMQELKKKYGL